MIADEWVLLGMVLQLAGGASYVVATLRGRAAPNRVTWLLWTVIPLVAFWAQLDEGIGWVAAMTLGAGLCPLLVVVASFFGGSSVWRLGRLDVACGALSVGGIVLWQVVDSAVFAIVFAILADLLAAVPTVVKAFRAPQTENHWSYVASAVAAVIALLAVERWTVAEAGFPLYIFVICVVIAVLIVTRVGAVRAGQRQPR